MRHATQSKKRGLTTRFLACLTSVTLAASMVPAVSVAAYADDESSAGVFEAPTEAKETGTYVTAAVHAAAESVAFYLGIDSTTYRSSSFNAEMSLEEALSTPRLGIFGSSWNENADTYYWNFFYNAYASANGLTLSEDVPLYSGLQGSPSGADSSGTTVSTRSDILVGISSTDLETSYEGQIAALEENTDDDPDNDYDPYLVGYDMTNLNTMIATIYSLAEAAEDVMEDSGGTLTTRYNNGDVMESAEDYEEIVLSTQYYILSKIADGTTDRKNFVYVTDVDKSTNTLTVSTSDPSTFGRGSTRMMEAIENCADNLANNIVDQMSGSGTSYTMTVEQLAALDAEYDIDYIILGGNIMAAGGQDHTSGPDNSELNASLETVLAAANVELDADVYVNTCNAVNVYGSNGCENALYVPSVLGYMYDDVVDQMALMGWWYLNLYHVKADYVQSAINIVCSDMTTVDGLDVPEGYDTTVEAMFEEGEAYYAANKDTIVEAYPNLISYDDYMADTVVELTKDNTSVATAQAEADGDAIAPVVSCNGTELTWNTDYTYKLYDAEDNRVWSLTDAGTYTIEITGISAYSGTVELQLEVAEADLYPDVTDSNAWYYQAVYYLQELGLMTGYADGDLAGYFGVGYTLARQEFVTMLWRYSCPDEYAAYTDEVEAATVGTTAIEGVKDGQYFTAAANWAVEAGVITGVERDGSYYFDGESAITFEEMATMMARLLSGDDVDTDAYDASALLANEAITDAASIDEWALGNVAWCVDNGLFTGYANEDENGEPDGTYTLAPLEKIARERAATIVYNAYQAGLMSEASDNQGNQGGQGGGAR